MGLARCEGGREYTKENQKTGIQQNFIETEEKSLGHETVFIESVTIKNNKCTLDSMIV